MDRLRWMRVVGDTLFAAGVLSLGWFVLGLRTGWSITPAFDEAVEKSRVVATGG
jgi:nitric oxide reductase subunit B